MTGSRRGASSKRPPSPKTRRTKRDPAARAARQRWPPRQPPRGALRKAGRPAVLKTRRFGYDGKGQVMVRDGGDPSTLFDDLGGQAQILEAFVAFEREISVVAARSSSGQIESFDVIENEHSDHILKTSRVPAAVTPAVAAEARRIAETIAEAFGYVGVLAVEMFVVKDGAG